MNKQWIMVDSSNLEAINYTASAEDPAIGELHIKFRQKGQHYVFYGVPVDVYNEMLVADSIGKFFHSNVKGNYKYEVL